MKSAGKADANAAFDASFLDIYTGGDKAVRDQVLRLFLTQAELLLGRLKAARGDQRAWHEAAHSLKGCASGVGASGLASLAREAEKRAGASGADQATLIDQLASVFVATAEQVKTLLSTSQSSD
ncbi:MAG: Hpt domain-containing protein [Alphaproteobacteria bacterium]